MALQDLLDLSQKRKKIDITEDRIKAIIPALKQYISFWREYPDLFVDFLCSMNPNNTFHFYFYQRVFLRIAMRHQYVYAVFPRRISARNI